MPFNRDEKIKNVSHKECRRCILHEGIKSVQVDSNGICNYCKDPSLSPMRTISEEDRLKNEIDLETTLKAAKGQGDRLKTNGGYDIAMGLSGGKDSTHLLDTLIHKYGLKVLPVAVDMGFMTKVAKDNIAQTCRVLGVQCVWCDSVAPLFMELFRWVFEHRRDFPARQGFPYKLLTSRVCTPCSDLLEGFVIQEAVRRNIPLILFGLSPDQNARFTYEIKPETMNRSWVPEFIQSHNESFSSDFRNAWWNPVRFKLIPRVIFPYHAWKYNEAQIIATVEKFGLIPPRNADPLVTNCDVLWAFSVYDARVYGCNSYIFPFAQLVRDGKADRDRWKKIFTELHPAIREGTIRAPAVRKFFKLLGYSLQEIYEISEQEQSI